MLRTITITPFILFILLACEEPLIAITDCTLVTDQIQAPQSEESLTVLAGDPEATRVAVTPPPACEVPQRNQEANLEINAELQDFNSAQEQKMLNAIERLKVIINSEKFKERVLAHNYKGEEVFVNSLGMSNLEIYNTIMLGAEKLSPEEDEEIDVNITLYFKNNSTVGYTYPDTPRIWVNSKFFNSYSYGKIAANIIHEWAHKLGFSHDFTRTSKRNFSVPYGLGTIVQELIDQM